MFSNLSYQKQINKSLHQIRLRGLMKSIKIQSKKNSAQKISVLQKKSNYEFLFLNNNPNPRLREQLASILAEICSEIEAKTPIKLNIQDRIKIWLQNKKNIEEEVGQVVNQFGNFVKESFRLLMKMNETWQKPELGSPEKIIRIKSEERIKYRLLRQGEGSIDLTDNEQNQEHKKQQVIYELKNTNKKLERKLLLLSTEFNKIKKSYETKIEKYKKLLNSSLMQLQTEINEQLNSEQEIYYDNEPKYKEIVSQRQQNMNSKNLRLARSQKQRSSGDIDNKIQRVTTQESNKYGSIPAIPILGSTKFQLSHHNYRRG